MGFYKSLDKILNKRLFKKKKNLSATTKLRMLTIDGAWFRQRKLWVEVEALPQIKKYKQKIDLGNVLEMLYLTF